MYPQIVQPQLQHPDRTRVETAMRAWFQNLFTPASGAAPSVPLGADPTTPPGMPPSPQSEQSVSTPFPRPQQGPVGRRSEVGEPSPHAAAPSEYDTDPLQAAFLVTLDDASRFRQVRPLGLGGFGAIYRAEDARSDSRVVIKHYERVQSTASHRIMLEAEVDALRHLKGVPGVPYLYDVLTKRGQPVAIVMEYIDGKTLDPSHLEDTTPEEKRAFLVQLLELLRGCHRRGECHGDIKPDNIMVDPNGKAHLIDWERPGSGSMKAVTRRGGPRPGSSRSARQSTWPPSESWAWSFAKRPTCIRLA